MKTQPRVSVVIIGRNEEEHLADCIRSLQHLHYPGDKLEIIYVDNDSSDRSLEIARRFPIRTIALKQARSTPGLARNAGLQAATGEFVHFIDGDMTMDPDWLVAALPAFADERVVAVVGRLREVRPQESLYNRFFDLGWETAPLGEIGAPGGGGLFRTARLRELGGYDDTLFGAEEIDLGYRLRAHNLKTLRIPHLMARHDIGMQSLRQFWRRGVRDGYWEMEMITRYFQWSWPLPQDYIWKMNVQLLAFASLLLHVILHPTSGELAAVFVLPAIFFCKKAWYYHRATGKRALSWLAAFFNYFNMFPIACGQLRFMRERMVEWWCRPAHRPA